MKFHTAAVAVLALATAPQAAFAQSGRITPVLSTSVQRTCLAETTRVTLMSNGVEIDGARPTVERQARGLRVISAPDGRIFEQTVDSPAGDILLRFKTAMNGAVTDSALTGSTIDAYRAATPGADIPALAFSMADDVPERLLLGQTFAVGDSYYPEALRRSLVGRMISQMGLGFPVNGAIDIRYTGEVTHEGRRAWRFAGEIDASGAGTVNGVPMSIDHTTRAEVLHDAETGLVLRYATGADTRIDVRGQPFQLQRNTDGYTCEIVPQ